jgi:hypothetical protein
MRQSRPTSKIYECTEVVKQTATTTCWKANWKFCIKKYTKYRRRNKTIPERKHFKIHLLEQESIRYLYKKRLNVKVQPITDNIEEDSKNIKEVVLGVAEESLGYKPTKKKSWKRSWNEELRTII